MGKPKAKYEVGTAATYISRTAAIKKLQLSLHDFQKLCILKGIYPREPLSNKKANKGATKNKVFYHTADIKFLANEPLINHFRQQKVFMSKMKCAKSKREQDKIQRLLDHKPDPSNYFTRIILERYPTFSHALRDMDDGLNLLAAFALLPAGKITRADIVDNCRRLTSEFYQYVMHAQCLTKVFVSIKGTYFQAQVMGEKVTWVVGHQCNPGQLQDVNLKTMATFVDFYMRATAFINFRLYTKLGLHYPPKLARSKAIIAGGDDEEDVYCLANELAGNIDKTPTDIFSEGDEEGSIADRLKELEVVRALFKGKRFFLNRECPKDILTLVIRNCGGIVSWDDCPNGKFTEDYNGINYHIIDRPIADFRLNRVYVQPQWVFDSFNFRKLLPVNKYAPGATLPPHLSPFVLESDTDYIPPERLDMLRDLGKKIEQKENKSPAAPPKPKERKIIRKPENVEVKEGAVYNQKKQELVETVQRLNSRKKLQEMMIPKKHKIVYKKMKFGIKRKEKEKRVLENKRKQIEHETMEE